MIVEVFDGTELEALDREYAWRWLAYQNGWTPICWKFKTPFDKSLIKDSAKLMAAARKWPFIT